VGEDTIPTIKALGRRTIISISKNKTTIKMTRERSSLTLPFVIVVAQKDILNVHAGLHHI
jgi:hypothetical protein